MGLFVESKQEIIQKYEGSIAVLRNIIKSKDDEITMLHQHFADKAVNKVIPRKEFYKVDINEIEKIVKENYNDTVQFTKIPVVAEYRQSLELESGRNSLENR